MEPNKRGGKSQTAGGPRRGRVSIFSKEFQEGQEELG